MWSFVSVSWHFVLNSVLNIWRALKNNDFPRLAKVEDADKLFNYLGISIFFLSPSIINLLRHCVKDKRKEKKNGKKTGENGKKGRKEKRKEKKKRKDKKKKKENK